MPRTLVTALLVLACLAAATFVACGDEQSRSGRVPGDTLTIFSSLPLQGPHADQAQSVVNAEKLALREAGGRVGDFKINFASADDATAGGDRVGWDPDKTAENARKAVENTRTIAYIGDFESGATAISLPITNEAGFAQVSPASTAIGLTKVVPGAVEAGEPDKFYPSGDRSFARVVPADDVQASAAARWTRQLGARTVFVLGDKSLEGDGLAELYLTAARDAGLRVVGQERMDPRDEDYVELARDVTRARPDAIYFGGGADSNAVQLWRDLHAAAPGTLKIGSHNLLVPDFYGRLGSASAGTYITSAALDPSQLPARGRRFVRDYRREFGEAPDRFAAYGHAAMALLLNAIGRAGDDAPERDRVIDETLATTGFSSAVGTISIDENGDTSLDRLSGYRVRNGRLSLAAALRGEPAKP
ncbi:MAG TPA: branched-chain amino acid ABC transporter substrate-binding protein [Solirubrobacterales bacterium]|nr:branched-chain amino acid ABC transporter substrate-binding protein [Solirubrobacterales bacterium]